MSISLFVRFRQEVKKDRIMTTRKMFPVKERRSLSLRYDEKCQLCFRSERFVGNLPRGSRPLPRKFHDLGGMFKGDLVCHHLCLFYAEGQDLIQTCDRLPGEEDYNGYQVSAIRSCIKRHQKRKCYICQGNYS